MPTRALALAILGGALLGCAGSGSDDDARLFAHPGSCDGCHSGNRTRAPSGWASVHDFPRDAVCATSGCHADVGQEVAHAHGPVAAGDCRACHVPHSSSQRRLLVREESDLCAGCHARLITCPTATGATSARCSSCHDPHGSMARHLLLEPATPRVARAATGPRS